MSNLRKKHLLLIILVLSVVVRLYQFNAPLADWHSWRQTDTSSVTRNLFTSGFDLLHPRFHDISNVPSGLDNPEGYRFVEFPLYNVFSAMIYSLFLGTITIEQAGRLMSIIASVSIVWLLYSIVKKYLNETEAYFVAAFYAFSPYTIYYGRTVLPDTTMVAAILAGIYFFDRWIVSLEVKKHTTKQWLWCTLAIIFTASAFLLKPYAIFFVLPMVIIAWNKWGIRLLTKWQLYLFVILSLLPVLFWRVWMTQFPEGIPANQWLLNGNGIRFRPSFFRWIGYERITKLISGYTGTILLLVGIFRVVRQKQMAFFLSFLVSSISYVVVFATGNVQHDYYQILIMPSIALFMGLGAYGIVQLTKKYHPFLGPFVLVVVIGSSFYFSWQQIVGYFNINNPRIVTVGRMVDAITPKDARVLALYQGDTTFLYHTNRQGWASFQDPLPIMIEKGADYLVQLDPTDSDIAGYQKEYSIAASGSGYIIVKLQ